MCLRVCACVCCICDTYISISPASLAGANSVALQLPGPGICVCVRVREHVRGCVCARACARVRARVCGRVGARAALCVLLSLRLRVRVWLRLRGSLFSSICPVWFIRRVRFEVGCACVRPHARKRTHGVCLLRFTYACRRMELGLEYLPSLVMRRVRSRLGS